MTRQKQLKIRIRARMARTGESYSTARLHVAGPADPVEHTGYRLHGGVHPVSAALANVLAHHGVRAAGAELTEALVFGIAGGPGAGYILWEFAHDGSRPVTLGFSAQWQYIDRAPLAALSRLGVPAEVGRTGGAVSAARALGAALDSGMPAVVWPDRCVAGYWRLPPGLDGMGGHPVVVHGRGGDHYRVDDRNLAPLTVPADRFDAARSRVGSYRNLSVVPRPDGDVPEQVLRAAVLDAIGDCATRLGGTSTSFAVPAWAKWARTVADRRAAKGWPRVFADRQGLAGALASVWEGTSPAGMTGGHLRDLTAAFLDDAHPLVGDTAVAADAWRAAAAAWHRVAEAALPADVPQFARLRGLTAAVHQAVMAGGDAGAADAEVAAGELWALRAELDRDPPLAATDLDDLFDSLAARLREVHAAEESAVTESAALARRSGAG